MAKLTPRKNLTGTRSTVDVENCFKPPIPPVSRGPHTSRSSRTRVGDGRRQRRSVGCGARRGRRPSGAWHPSSPGRSLVSASNSIVSGGVTGFLLRRTAGAAHAPKAHRLSDDRFFRYCGFTSLTAMQAAGRGGQGRRGGCGQNIPPLKGRRMFVLPPQPQRPSRFQGGQATCPRTRFCCSFLGTYG